MALRWVKVSKDVIHFTSVSVLQLIDDSFLREVDDNAYNARIQEAVQQGTKVFQRTNIKKRKQEYSVFLCQSYIKPSLIETRP